jgi:uncharacterized protein YdeI (YjbR/CyaY-like superfamily)
MSKMNPKVDAYLRSDEKWREETKRLRSIALRCGLTEEFKWGKPCYMFQERNVVIIQGFKDYCALMFCKGSLLKDPEGILKKPGEYTQATRQIRFANDREIAAAQSTVTAYVQEAIEAERNGLEVKFKKNPEPIPGELQKRLDGIPALKSAFFALTPGRQRAYILFFSAAKQSTTRESRIEKCMPRILQGKGLND